MRELRPYLKLIRGPALRSLMLGLLLSVLALFGAVGLLALAGWFITISAIAGLAAGASFSFAFPSAGVRAFALLRTTSRYGEKLVNHRATFQLLARLRAFFFERALALPAGRFARYRSGDLLGRAMSDIDALDNAPLRILVPTVSTLLGAGGFVIFVVSHSTALALLVAAGLLISGAGLPLLSAKLGREPGARLVRARAELRTECVEALEGLPEIRSYGAEEPVRNRLDHHVGEAAGKTRTMRRLEAAGQAVSTFSASAVLFGVLWLGLSLFTAGDLSGPVVAMICLLTVGLLEGAGVLPAAYQFLGHTREAARRLGDVFVPEDPAPPAPGDEPFPSTGTLRLRNLSFSYEGRRELVLDSSNLVAPPGSLVTVAGPSGAGKSTLLKLIAGEIAPTNGEVSFGDTPLTDIAEDGLHEHLTFVAQDEHLFDATVGQNLFLARPQATEKELQEVLEVVCLSEFIEGLAEGLDTRVGEHGYTLSGGQRKRLCVARGLLRYPEVLLLDEPTDGVDNYTAEKMMAGVRGFLPGSTLIVATHEPSLINSGDIRIVF